MEGPDHVLARRMIDGRLSADRGIDLRQQGRGNLDERRAALKAGRRKAGHVANNAAAQGHERGLPFARVFDQRIEDLVQG